jgi:ribose transport system ATP-binding protein
LVRREAGKVRVNGRPVEIHSPADAISAGIAYVTNDRRGEGLALILPVGENLTLPILPKLSRAGVLDVRREAEVATQLVDRLSIRTPALAQPVEFLSGGNQQKVSVGRWLKAEPSILIVDEPTVGVDVGAKVELYEMIRELAAEGMAIIMLSADSRELLGLCDRIIVVADGRIVSEQIVAEASEESLVRAAVTASRSQEAPGLPQKIAVTTRETDGVDRHPRRAAFFTRWTPSLLLVVLLTCLALYTTLRSPYFLTAMNLSSLGFQWAPIALAAFGQTLVLLVAGVDMSIGPVVSLITTELSYLLVSGSGASFAVSLAVALATGLAVGLLNGLLIRYLKIPDLIVTLAMYFSIMGVALLVRPAPGGVVAASFMDALTYQLGPVPVAVVLVVALCIAGDIILTRTRVGAYIYATGSARGAAYESGVPVARVRLTVYIIAGLSACVAGLLVTAQIGSGDPSVGTNYTLESVMAAVVGGASLFGGRGTLIGAMLGALLIAGVQNFLELLGVSSYYLYVWTGGLTLLAVALYSTDYLPRLVRILLGLFVRRSEGGLAEGGLESR